jgi:glycosyltransferase involved in cell wall biosynthesis
LASCLARANGSFRELGVILSHFGGQSPRVSILIPCFNAAPWIHRSIETALAQTWPNKEVIVLDDGSTDGSWQALEKYKPHVQIERQSNRGQNASRNRLTEMSRGEWLVYLDADDELAHDSIAEKMKFCDCAEAIYGTMEWARFRGDEKTGSATRIAEDYPDKWDAFSWWRYPNTSAFLFNRRTLLNAGGWNERRQKLYRLCSLLADAARRSALSGGTESHIALSELECHSGD